jgi:hypothetical protein
MSTPFIVFGLPRSRTFWLSKFLSYREWTCGHEESLRMRSLQDVRSWLNLPCTGSAETAAAPWWRLLAEMRPDTRAVIVRRPVAEVVRSLLATGVQFDGDALAVAMQRLDTKLDQVAARWPGALSVNFHDLANEDTCARVFEHCLPYQHDHAWWAAWAPINMQINFIAMTCYGIAHAEQLTRLARTAKQHSLAKISSRSVSMEGMTFQQEPFDTFLRDGQALFAEHLVQVGEAPDAAMTKNIPVMRALDAMGAMQITTARSNGRMFGYLMTVVGPSLESPDQVEAMNATFYASKLAPGLGLKLQRASVNALRERGVDIAYLRAGTRGDGPRLGTLYRRLGAQPAGEMFSLNLRETA